MEFPKDKTIYREVTIKSSDPAIEDATWVLGFSINGMTIRRKGEQDQLRLSWRSIVGHALIHRGK